MIELQEKAKIVFQQIYSQNPKLPQNIFYGLQLASLEKDTIKGNFFYNSLIQIDSLDHRSMNYWGYTLIDYNLNLKLGIELIHKALTLRPSEAAYLDSKSWYFYKTNQFDSAWSILQKIPEIEKNDPEFDLHAALILEKMKQTKKAQFYWGRLKTSYPFHPLIPSTKAKK